MLEIRLLGPVEARRDNQLLVIGRQQQRALLALLALNANRVVSVDRLVDALWGEQPPATAPTALYGLVSGLRKLLEPDTAGNGEGRVILTQAPGYLLELPPEQIDFFRFDLLAAEGRVALAEGDAEKAAARLSLALELWRGPPLQDVGPLPFAQSEIARLEELQLAALEDRIDADLAAGRNGDLVAELEPLVADHPLRERTRGQLMRALYRTGRQADALAVYRDTRRMLVDELGLEPGERLQELERAILRHDPSLDPRQSLATDAPLVAKGDAAIRAPVRASPHARRRTRWIAATLPLLALALWLSLHGFKGGSGGRAVQIRANGVGIIERGKVVAAGSLGASPSDVAVGAGSVWVSSTEGHTVARVDPETGGVRQTIQVGSGASGIAADDRAVWVANSLDGTVSRVDPRANKVVQTIPVGSAPVAIALGRGAVWVASEDDQTLSRLDAHTGILTARVPVGAAPRAIAIGAGGIWVADEVRGVVFRVDPAQRTIVDTINVGNGPSDIAVGTGSVWVANNLDGTVSRINPGRAVVTATIPVGDGPRGIAVLGDQVWVSNEFDGRLALIDPRTNSVTQTVQLGQRPQGLAVMRSRLFVAVQSGGDTHRGGVLRLVGNAPYFGGSVDTLNSGTASVTISTNDGLVAFRRVGGVGGSQLVPDLAVTLPTPTDGGRTYTFRLRPGIHYSNGRLVRPQDFRRALERSFLIFHDVSYYGAILGAHTCASTPKRCDLTRGIVTDDRAQTVVFHLRAPDPDFLFKLALPDAFAVPVETSATDVGTHPLPATGPYMIGSFAPDRELTLVRNPRFREWSKAAQPAGYPDRITWKLSIGTRAEVRAVENDRADVAYDGVPPELEREVETQYASQVHTNPSPAITYLFLNTRVPPFADVRVRRAVNYAADRATAALRSAHGNGALPTCQILPPNFPGFRAYCPYTLQPSPSGVWQAPDPERAHRLVAASGTAGAVVTVWVPDNHRAEGPFVARLLRSLGYRTRLKRVSDSTYYNPATGPGDSRRRVQAGLLSWFADYPAASNYINILLSCSAFIPQSGLNANFSEFCNRRIEARIRQALALQATDPYLANQLWSQVDHAIVDQAPFVPLFTLKHLDLVSERVGNYQYNPQWGVLLDQLWVR